jgi:hypothetical protein
VVERWPHRQCRAEMIYVGARGVKVFATCSVAWFRVYLTAGRVGLGLLNRRRLV